MRKMIVAGIVSLSLAIGGCAGMTKEDTGGLAGMAVGAAVGSNIGDGRGQILATFVGAVLGAMAGSSVGRTLDGYDELHAQRVLEYNATGAPTSWVNPDTGHEVEVVPTRTYQTAGGQYCREYQTTVEVGGKTENAYGTACRQPDGSWKIQN